MTIDEIRDKGRADLFFFAKVILGYDKLRKELHQPWCEWATDFSQKRKLRMAPRTSFKSSVLAVSLPLWCLIQQRPVVRGVTGKNLRILIASSTRARAEGFLREIDGHLRRNKLFRACFGNLISSEKWTESEKTIATRSVNRKEASLTAVGRGEALASIHPDLCVADDLCSELDRRSETERQRTIQWARDLASLVDTGGSVLYVGTPWHHGDLYRWIEAELNPQLREAGQEIYDVQKESCWNPDGSPRFARVGLTKKKLEQLRIERGSFDFASQYELRPVPAESLLFPESEILLYDTLPNERFEFFGFLDPSLGKTATSDYSAIVTLARGDSGVYCVDADVERRGPQRILSDCVRKFNSFKYSRFGVEDVAFQSLLINDLEATLAKEGKPFRCTRVGRTKDKIARLQEAQGRILGVRYPRRFKEENHELWTELVEAPFSRFDDGVDALEGAVSLIHTGYSLKELHEILKFNAEGDAVGDSLASEIFKNPF